MTMFVTIRKIFSYNILIFPQHVPTFGHFEVAIFFEVFIIHDTNCHIFYDKIA